MHMNIFRDWTKHLDFTILDIICLEAAFLISYIIRNGYPSGGLHEPYRNMSWAIVFVDILVIFFFNSYDNIIKRDYVTEIKRVILHSGAVTVGLIVWMFIFKESSTYSRFIVFLMYPSSVCFSIAARLCWKRIIRLRITGRKDLRKILIISTEARIEDTINLLLQPYENYQLNACILYDTSAMIGRIIKDVPVVADKENIIKYIQDNIIDEVFIDLPGQEKQAEKLMNIIVSMGLIVHLNLARFTTNVENKQIQRFAAFMVLSSSMKFATPRQLLFKRGLDISGSIVGLFITGVAFLIFGPIIKKQSSGPVFFSQERVGRNGRRFRIYKFRTMYPDAEERKEELWAKNKMNGYMFKLDNDPRIIPIGRFLRKSSIDELPQFLNVLKGDMSLVGTRPPTVDEYKQYEVRHRKRLAMRPGLTGMWQVSGRSNIIDFEEVVALDAKYITEWTLGLDLKIIGKTILIVLGRKGAV